MKQFLLTTVLALSTLAPICAQVYTFSDEPETFVLDVKAALEVTSKPEALEAMAQMDELWSGALPGDKKARFMEVMQLLVDRKFKAYPHFSTYIRTVHAATGPGEVRGADLDTLFLMIESLAKTQNKPNWTAYLTTLRRYYEEDLLYQSSFNKLYALGGKGHLRLLTPPEPEPEPEYAPEPEDYETYDPYATEDYDAYEEDWEADVFDDWETESWGTEDWSAPAADPVVTAETVYEFAPPPLPTLEGEILHLDGVDLVIVTQYDSVALKKTSGDLMIPKGIWVGEGGTFDWAAAGLPEVYAEMKGYDMVIRNPKLTTYDATLNHPGRVKTPPEGIFNFESKPRRDTISNSFPRFMSYDADVVVEGLGEGMRYEGGYSLRGHRFSSASYKEGESKLVVERGGQDRLEIRAPNIAFGDSTITAMPAAITIRDRRDSIYHPGMEVRYNRNTQRLFLRKDDKGGYRNAPVIDSYHQIEMIIDGIIWNLEDSLIAFQILQARNRVPALFESMGYFDEIRYLQLRGIYNFHPLQMAVNYSYENRRRDFLSDDLAKRYNINPSTMRAALAALEPYGYLDYDPIEGRVTILEKGSRYFLARLKKKDYDHIQIISLYSAGPNAELNLNDMILTVHGVSEMQVSDSLDVRFIPEGNNVRIGKDMLIEFDGEITTTNHVFKGRNLRFDYQNFLVSMDSVAHIVFTVPVPDSTGAVAEGQEETLENTLQNSSGTLYINKPENRANLQSYPEYPYFDAEKGGYFYFDSKSILEGAYDKSVKFEIPPFVADSLSANLAESIKYPGTFFSGDIFPPFEETIGVLPDKSFGFIHPIPAEGYALYGTTAKAFGTIRLSRQGIRLDGRVEYLNTVVYSNDFVMYLDRVQATCDKGTTKPGINKELDPKITFPQMAGSNFQINWLPYKDSLYMETVGTGLFDFYDHSAKLQGVSTVNRGGMYGSGILETRGSRTFSTQYHFEQKNYGGRNAKFEILSEDPVKPALLSDNVNLQFRLDSGYASFSPEVRGFASNSFPYLQYKSSLSQGRWDLDKRLITLKGTGGSSDYFYSTHPKQDSLVFNAESALYVMDSTRLDIAGVERINVVDAWLYPHEEKVVIRADANMDHLSKVRIVADTTNGYHTLVRGEIDIFSRQKFDGHAIYPYVNTAGDSTEIPFDKFTKRDVPGKRGDVETHTVSYSEAKTADSAYIAPKMLYEGKVSLYAENQILAFDGSVRLDLRGPLQVPYTLKYKMEENVDQVRVPVDGVTTERGFPTFTGIHRRKYQRGVYLTFLTQKIAQTDPSVFEAFGLIEYDQPTESFRIGSQTRLADSTALEGNLITYNEEQESLTLAGKFDFIPPWGEEVKDHPIDIYAAGSGTHTLKDSLTELDVLVDIDFVLPPGLLGQMGSRLGDVAEMISLPRAKSYKPADRVRFAPLIGEKASLNFQEKALQEPVGWHTASGKFSKGVIMGRVKMRWSHEQNAWYSVGPITLSSCGNTTVNAQLLGYLEIGYGGEKEKVTLYLEANATNWYFFRFQDNHLFTSSSNDDYNVVIQSKSKESANAEKGLYYFAPEDPVQKAIFINRYKSNYLGITPSGVEIERSTAPEMRGFEDYLEDSE